VIRVEPGRVEGAFQAPPSKSVTHRAYLLASQAERPATVTTPLRAADCDATLAGLQRLGARAHLEGPHVRFEPAPLVAPVAPLDCRNAGTTLRLLAATAARLGAPVRLVGDASLSRRTSVPLWKALRGLGVQVESQGGCPPVLVRGPLRPGVARLDPHVSSQYGTALALSLPFLDAPSTLHLAAPIDSAPYLALTHALATAQGLRIRREAQGAGGEAWAIEPSRPKGGVLAVEGDWSSAAFPLAAGHLTGGKVAATGLDAASLQPDRVLPRLLAALREGDERTLDLHASPDLFPALAVAAAFAPGTTRLAGGTQLRNKEADRLAAMATNLRRMGVRCGEDPDALVVHGGKPKGATLSSFGDHRIHMALCVAAVAADGPSAIDGDDLPAVSFPAFHATLAALGARIFKDGRRVEAAP
jgi:3-phosphoshikimate 1-carboxyvinyltransferase